MKKRLLCLLTGISLIGLLASLASAQVYEVVSPLGEPTVKMIPMARRLDTLEGKTICEVHNQAFKADVTFPVIQKLLQEKYRGVKVIPYTEMPSCTIQGMGPTARAKTVAALIASFKEKGCEAVISGNGG